MIASSNGEIQYSIDLSKFTIDELEQLVLDQVITPNEFQLETDRRNHVLHQDFGS